MPPSASSRSASLPYKSHPLYRLRLALLITVTLGTIINIFAAISSPWGSPAFIWTIFLLILSAVFCIYDLISYALHKATLPHSIPIANSSSNNSDEDGDNFWPRRRLLVGDAVLAILFQWTFWGIAAAIIGSYAYYYEGGRIMLQSYGNLANLVASILHAVVFWKELMARQHAKWLAKQERRPCSECGHVRPGESETEQDQGRVGDDLIGSAIGKLPEWVKGRGPEDIEAARGGNFSAGRGAEHECLITPNESEAGGSGGYGTVAGSVQTLNSEAETIVKKKGKKRVVEAA